MSVLDITTNASSYDDRLNQFCREYGTSFQEFTLIEKYDILAAIGLWGGYCAENDSISLTEYIADFLDTNPSLGLAESDAKDMLIELGEVFDSPQDAMGLVMAVSAQLLQSIWLEVGA